MSNYGTKRINSLLHDPASEAKPPSLYMHVCQESRASIETSFENPAAWKCCMKASMRADGMTSHSRCDLDETAGVDDMEGT